MMTMVTTHCDDAKLVRLHAEQHSEEAFAELVRRHIGLVHSAALRQVGGNGSAAADITQAVFIELAWQSARLTRHPALVGWLYTTTHQMAAHYIRDETRRLRREHEAHAMQELHRSDHDADADWDRIHPVIDAAMHDLGETDRVAVLLRFFERRPFAEVGARLGLSENGARMRVDRALEKLRAKLEKHGVTSTASALAAALAGPAVAAAPAALVETITATAITALAATTSTIQLPTLMAFAKLKTASLAAALVVAGTAIMLQYQAANRLRMEKDGLQHRIKQLAEETQAQRQAADLNTEELARLRASQRELLRLRGEVALLRTEKAKLAATAPRSPTEGGQPPKDTLIADVGTDTPENASTSLIWTITNQNKNRFMELVKFPDDVSSQQAAKLYDHLFRQFTNAYSRWQFHSISKTRVDEDGTVRLYFDFLNLDTGDEGPLLISLRKYDSDWKVVIDDVPRADPAESGNSTGITH